MIQLIRGSLRNKLIVFLLFSIIIPITCSIIISYVYTKEAFKKESIQNNTKLIYQGSSNLLNYLDRLNQASLLIYSNPSITNSLYNIILTGASGFAYDKEIESNLLFIYNTTEEIHSIYLYLEKQDKSFRVANSLPRKMASQTYDPKFETGDHVRMDATHTSHHYGFNNSFDTPENVISFHRQILNAPSPDIMGFISIDVTTEAIDKISSMLFNKGHEQFYIVDQTGGVIYSSEPNEASGRMNEDWVSEAINMPGQSGHYEYNSSSFKGIHMYQKVETPDVSWTIVKRVPYEYLYQNARMSTLINSLIITLFLVIAVIATVYISFRFTAPIKQLIRYISKIEIGQLDVHFDSNRTDEIGILSKRFRQMMQRINHLIIREYRWELSNKTQQLKTLQAQVNPHFMNNALQSIGTLALQHGDKKVYGLISSLGKMMRYTMNTNETFVPLKKEIDHVRSYLALQQQRFDGKQQFDIQADDDTLSIQIPKMIIQPLVENCFKHGFADSLTSDNLLMIACKLVDQNKLEITVEDNGVGIEEDRLKLIQSALNRPQHALDGQQSEQIGMMNVQSRLQLNSGKDAQMLVQPGSSGGLKVTLQIPLSEGGDSV
ncbi:cache domain-containing sensor histidine kinase [Paenibacillus paeoniae]|uniref:cache domain-containing sensor histidine kinase n=1 Tax=Paenibacillus paeoniae TaxID=2292705 RepID=UPI0014042096|nr:sensor histidine kinase [Paenibacillus paeoniae]